jgi:pyridoxamine 5'-phosphate oxidase
MTISVLDDPMTLVGQWLDEAVNGGLQPNPTSMTLATTGHDARPSARIVLIKGVNRELGFVEFYTNYGSRKARELDANGWAAGTLHWDAMGRQLRLEGPVRRSPPEASDAYFATRPWRSQINAWASRQSAAVANPGDLEQAARRIARDFGLPDPFDAPNAAVPATSIPRPEFWGGYRLWLTVIEFWRSGQNRFHERIRYERELRSQDSDPITTGPWSHARLQP